MRRFFQFITKPFRFIASTRIGLPVLLVAGTALIVALLIATRPRLEPVQKPERVWPVDVVKARYQTVQPELNLFGEIVAGRRSELLALVGGRIVEVGPNLREGGIVKQGELLVQIDPFQYETDLANQRSQLKEAEVRLEMLRRDHERAKELFAEKNVSEQFMDTAELDMLQQEAIVEQREIAVEQAARDLTDSRLVAPFDGVIGDVNANLGKQISGFGADKVADLIDMSELEVRFSLSNAQYGRLIDSDTPVVGRPVGVSWQVGNEVLTYSGRIERVGAEIASTTGGVDAYAVIDTAGKQVDLRPGAFVSVALLDRRFADVLEAPESALYGEDIIYVIQDGRLSERRIDIQGYAGNNILFTALGDTQIEDGDLIVTTQIREGGAGARVDVR